MSYWKFILCAPTNNIKVDLNYKTESFGFGLMFSLQKA